MAQKGAHSGAQNGAQNGVRSRGQSQSRAQRGAGKSKPGSVALKAPRRAGAKAPKAEPAGSEPALKERLAALERECSALRTELELERGRRRALEEVHAATRDRISWALDSLQGILNGKTCLSG